MAYEMRPNSGTLFKNDEKKEPNHADYQGEALIDGKVYWFNAWIKEGKRGKFMSCSFREKTKKGEKPVDRSKEVDDSIPF